MAKLKTKLVYAPALILAIAGLGAGEAHANDTWTRGPGVYSFRICAKSVAGENPNLQLGDAASFGKPGGDSSSGAGGAGIAGSSSAGASSAPRGGSRVAGAAAVAGMGGGCDMTGLPRQSVTLTIEAWGGGGGGGGGASQSLGKPMGGEGGGGGGGGGYGKKVLTVQVPMSGAIVWYVQVGSKGAGGLTTGAASVRDGGNGGLSQVRVGTASGAVLVSSTGGRGGNAGYSSFGNNGGGPGVGTPDPWAGTSGLPGGDPTGCDGMAGGFGGAGGGPGRTGPGYINDGGNGGHGGYKKKAPQCLNHGNDYLLTGGAKGGDGLVTITW
ncbi:hypothetical protein MCEMIH16_02742 [Caulobacteraceae bacterium]